MSLMVGSLSSGSSGPRPVISSRISETKSASSCVFSASRSASTYCDTSCWTCRRVSSSGNFSSAERLISSISRRCRRTLASSSLSLSSRSAAACGCNGGACSAGNSGGTVLAAPPSAGGADSSIAGGSGAATRRTVKRPAIAYSFFLLLREGKLEFFDRRRGLAFCRRLAGRGIHHQLLELRGDLVAWLYFVERHAAVDRLAHQSVIVGDRGHEGLSERLLEVAAAQAGREHAVLKAVDDDLRIGPVTQPFLDRRHQLLGVTQARHGGLADDEQFVRAEQHAVGPGEPGARHVEHDKIEIGGDEVEQARYHVGIERPHLRRPVRRSNHGEAGRVIREHDLEQLPVETIRPRFDFRQVKARLEIEIVGHRAILEI